jgi:hypothetical protein
MHTMKALIAVLHEQFEDLWGGRTQEKAWSTGLKIANYLTSTISYL